MSKKPSISVVLSTYNAEAWLEKVLYGFQYQDFKDFELVIADDGSRKETKDHPREIAHNPKPAKVKQKHTTNKHTT